LCLKGRYATSWSMDVLSLFCFSYFLDRVLHFCLDWPGSYSSSIDLFFHVFSFGLPIFLMWKKMWLLSLWDWLILSNLMIFSSIYFSENDIILFLFMTEWYSSVSVCACVCVWLPHFVYSIHL
jgi:hypothetical protein